MKLLMTLIFTWIATLTTMAESAPILFRSVVKIAGAEVFSVSTQDEITSEWVSVGDRFVEYTIDEFVPNENILVISKDDEEWRIPLVGRRGRIVQDESVISVATLGFIKKPGMIEIRGERPTVLDVWKAAGGGLPGTGRRLVITRRLDDSQVEHHEFGLSLDLPEPELEAELKRIPLFDRDVLFFPAGAD